MRGSSAPHPLPNISAGIRVGMAADGRGQNGEGGTSGSKGASQILSPLPAGSSPLSLLGLVPGDLVQSRRLMEELEDFKPLSHPKPPNPSPPLDTAHAFMARLHQWGEGGVGL